MDNKPNENAEAKAYIEAISRVQAVIEFDLKGHILTANDNFLNTLGYELDEIVGSHHRIFCEPAYAASTEYEQFWERLGRGEFEANEYKRIAKDGQHVWINASYNPVLDDNGKPVKIVKFATDITKTKMMAAEQSARMDALDRVQAIIEFTLDGTVLSANKNFLDTLGYSLDEIAGQHHRIFCDPEYANSQEYTDFWERLGKGLHDSGQYKRIDKNGNDVWINASYNPVYDAEGVLIKVVKFATNITEDKLRNADYEGKIEAINRTQAVIEFLPDGTILSINENFAKTFGYSADEVIGEKHKMFCDESHAHSEEYADFWAGLRSGKTRSGLFQRVAKGGRPLWIQGNYNPILDPEGKPVKIVKFATDSTHEIETSRALQTDVATISASLESMSKEISEETEKVASNAQSLGATTEEMSSSVEELSASIDSIAQNSKFAEEQAITTQARAETGVQAIEQSIESMELINKSSEEIKDILMVISEIASQTNLLAFNAAIEAARAGDHGLGFSVVADEVRKLAERSSQATHNISKLINESTRRIDKGSEVSREAGEAFRSIVEGVVTTAKSISQITAAASEQQIAARDVAQAIDQVAVTAETSAGATTIIAGSTKNLADRASELMNVVTPAA